MLCKAVESGTEFSFVCDTTKISNVISKIINVTSFSKSSEDEKQHVIISYGGKLYVVGYSPETFVVLEVDGVDTNGQSSFGFSPQTILGIIKNRKDLKFTYDGKRLRFEAVKGKYTADLNTVEITKAQANYINSRLKPQKGSEQNIEPETLDKIRSGVKYTDLTNFYNKDEKPLCFIRQSKSDLKICSFDNFHIAQYTTKVSSENSFSLPISTDVFRLMDKFIAEEKEKNAKFCIRSNSFEVTGSKFLISLPPVQVDDSSYTKVDTFLKGLKSSIGRLKFSSSGVDTVNNMFTIAKEDSRLTMKVSSGIINISLSTEEGTISDSFESFVELLNDIKSLEFKIDPRIFADLFKKVNKGDIPIYLYSKKNAGTSSCFVIRNRPDDDSKLVLIGTYYEQ